MKKIFKKIVIKLPEDLYKKFKIVSKNNKESIDKIICILLKKYLKKNSIVKISSSKNSIEELVEKQMEKDINKILGIFYKSDETTKHGLLFQNRNQRAAVKRLIMAHGFEDIVFAVEVAMEIRTEPYAPIITSPIQLEAKLINLKLFIERKKNEGGKIVEGTDFSKTVEYSEQDLKNFKEINEVDL